MIIISGPSSVGKSTLIDNIVRAGLAEFIVPLTTRAPRPEETGGRDYQFWTKPRFQSGILSGEIGHWDYALGNYYGFLEGSFGDQPGRMTHALARMAIRIRTRNPNCVLVFLRPVDVEEHLQRLRQRCGSEEEFRARGAHCNEELELAPLFDHILDVEGGLAALKDTHASLWRQLGIQISE